MDKKLLILSILLATILIISGCEQQKNSEEKTTTNIGDIEKIKNTQTTGNSEEVSGVLAEILNLGNSYQCNMQSKEGTTIIKIKGKNYRQETIGDVLGEDGKSTKISLTTISKDEGNELCFYSITSAKEQIQCTKNCFDKVQRQNISSESSNVQLKCLPAVITDSEFNVPNNCKNLYQEADPIGEFDQGIPYAPEGTSEPNPY